MQRVVKDALISGAALIILLLGLIAIDPRVRERIDVVVQNGLQPEVRAVTSTARDVSRVVLLAARDRSIDQAPVVVFVFAASVLVLGMLRL